MQFTNTIWLWGLTALAVPVAIHLLSRKEGKVIRIGSIRHLHDANTKQFKSLRLNEVLLLALRCLMIVLLVLLLSGAHVNTSIGAREKWVVIEQGLEHDAGLAPLLDSLKRQGFIAKQLSPGFPPADSAVASTQPDYWTLAERLAQQHIEQAIVLSHNKAAGFKGDRVALPPNITWIAKDPAPYEYPLQAVRTAPDSLRVRLASTQPTETSFRTTTVMQAGSTTYGNGSDSVTITSPDTLRVALVNDDAFAYDKDIMLAALQTVEQSVPAKFIITTYTTNTYQPTHADWVIWLAASNAKDVDEQFKGNTIATEVSGNLNHGPLLQQRISPAGTQHWRLTQRLTESVALGEKLPLLLAEIMVPKKALTQRAAQHDRRVQPTKQLWSAHAASPSIPGASHQSKNTAAPLFTIALLLTLIVERIISLKKKPMSAAQARYNLLRMKQRYRLVRAFETLLGSAGVGLLVFSILRLITPSLVVSVSAAIAAGLLYATWRVVNLNLIKLSNDAVVRFINQQYPQVEDSADLLLRDDADLTTLQQLQKLRSLHQFEALYPAIKLPHQLGQAFAILAVSALAYVALTAFAPKPTVTTARTTPSITTPVAKENLPAAIQEARIVYTPPAYTGIPPQSSTAFELKIPEGTSVQWTITFTQPASDVKLIFSGKDSLALRAAGKFGYTTTKTFAETSFYQVVWTNTDGTRKYSDYYPIEIIRDQPPTLAFEKLPQFTTLTLKDKLKVNVDATLQDDYGLKDAYIIATVSKGSGESVKFREEKLRFDRPQKINGRQLRASKIIDILALGLEPGDELYFYAEGFDTKTPTANRTRTETFFIALQDTSTQVTSADPGLGVDLMPDYFRSQRQIIIDSEKLLREKKNISKQEFNSRSNELAYDQKVLRLRYGEFLGEEFESGIGPQSEAPGGHDDHEEEDPTKKYGHVHDTENEHNLVDDKKSSTKETHGHAHEEDSDDPVKAYTHAHDSEEEATFFQQSIRAKLKAAITVMWDAELHLRLYDPKTSLPFQYKALKLLKEVSQDSRIYVHRTGFDPPPLKEEKRLTGELTEVGNSTAKHSAYQTEQYPNIRRATVSLEAALQSQAPTITPALRDALLKAGPELSAVAIAQPGRYLKSLSLIKAITENELKPAEQREALLAIRKAFWSVLPRETASPQARTQTTHPLDQRFLRNMKALKKP